MQAMRYKEFTWPNNPARYTLCCERLTAVHKMPMGSYCVQDLGRSRTVLRGEGEFFGAGAYARFRALVEVFAQDGAGVLRHPVWNCQAAYFTRLELTQEPRPDYVAYSFAFCDAGTEVSAPKIRSAAEERTAGTAQKRYHTVAGGDTLWGICRRYGLSMQQMLAMNPGIQNPNLIRVGEELRVG